MHRVLNYPGSKWNVADWIVGLMPPHKSYLEPFFGSGAVFFSKQKAPIETINDLDGEIVNLFSVIRRQPEALATALALTPYSRQEYNSAWDQLRAGEEPDDVERARLTLIRYWQAQGCCACKKAGWKNDVAGREAAYAVRNWSSLPGWVMDAALRLKDAQIEHMPATDLIRRFRRPEVLIYADPPYLRSTRSDWQYHQELDEDGHVELLRTLIDHPGPVILSGYDNELYYDMLPRSWEKLQHPAQAQGGKPRMETLWVNFEIQLRLAL